MASRRRPRRQEADRTRSANATGAFARVRQSYHRQAQGQVSVTQRRVAEGHIAPKWLSGLLASVSARLTAPRRRAAPGCTPQRRACRHRLSTSTRTAPRTRDERATQALRTLACRRAAGDPPEGPRCRRRAAAPDGRAGAGEIVRLVESSAQAPQGGAARHDLASASARSALPASFIRIPSGLASARRRSYL